MYDDQLVKRLEIKVTETRSKILELIYNVQSGHCGGSFSAVEIVTCLFHHKMKIDPQNPEWEDRDRFILSKGHAAPLLYVNLADLGFFPKKELAEFRQIGGILQGHPDKNKTPGVDMTSGSLGMGLSIGIGLGLSAKLNKKNYKTYVLMGDGELNEGQVWEAAMFASKMKINNVTAIVDYNGVQLDGSTNEIMPLSPLKEKWESFGWRVIEVNGHDIADTLAALDRAEQITDTPVVIIADTIKGKGVSFMEDDHKWHGQAPCKEEYERAIAELERADIQ
ncbi:transketolase [Iocasia frigidifontis]|uniref:Transketolase n=1 Tax=Iocasia fonsfrigidae TaxID=2682810 RepID=A0A8A7KI31_9FIRM|nr:transketolase [Iocasia fonsfrigidae]QTL99448.1 transketolase [Iocasia fonsfrigidae]